MDKTIGSMSEFKQTLGRGTRIKEHYKVGEEEKSKTHFILMDFRKNYLKFNDPDFDGDIEIVEGGTDIPLRAKKKKKRDVFRINGVNVEIAGQQIMYLDENMQLVKEVKIEECVKNNILDHFANYEDFKVAWKKSSNKKLFAYELLLDKQVANKLMENYGLPCDYFDLIGLYGFGIPIPSKEMKIDNLRPIVEKLPAEQKRVLEIVLEVYKTTDWTDLRLIKVLSLPPFVAKGYTIRTALKPFGGKEGYEKIIDELEDIQL